MTKYIKAAERLANLKQYAPDLTQIEYEIASRLAEALQYDPSALDTDKGHALVLAYLIESAYTEIEKRHFSSIPKIMIAADFPEDSIKALSIHLH